VLGDVGEFGAVASFTKLDPVLRGDRTLSGRGGVVEDDKADSTDVTDRMVRPPAGLAKTGDPATICASTDATIDHAVAVSCSDVGSIDKGSTGAGCEDR
jgi:hypothetical protein